jgi:FSR family fosmidomycin resistance protein-like MFS transporter
MYRLMFVGWGASFFLYFRLREVSARPGKPSSIRAILPHIWRLFIPLTLFVFFRNFLVVNLVTFLPTFLTGEGFELAAAGRSLAILELAGVGGALLGGTLSDRLGRKPVLLTATLGSSIMMFAFLNVSGWLQVVVLLALGFTSLSTNPVLLSVVQEHFPKNRAIANSLFMLVAFAIRPIHLLAIGSAGDQIGLRAVYFWSAIIILLAVPAILWLPNLPTGTKVAAEKP